MLSCKSLYISINCDNGRKVDKLYITKALLEMIVNIKNLI